MKNDSLTRYVQIHASLLKEKAALESRLTQINQALAVGAGTASRPVAAAPVKAAAKASAPVLRKKRAVRRRADNELTLLQAMGKAMGANALTKPEIRKGIEVAGYKFTGSNPMNSINVKLYTKGLFKKHPGGKFSVIK